MSVQNTRASGIFVETIKKFTMKKVVILLMLFIGFTGFSQVSLKGYTVGKKLTVKNPKETTVAGIAGRVLAKTLEDNRIYLILFAPVVFDDFGDYETTKITNEQLDILVKGVENNYDVVLKNATAKTELEKKATTVLRAEKNNVEFTVLVTENNSESLKLAILIIKDIELYKIHDKELQSDF